MMFSSIRILTRLRSHSSSIITRSINVTIARPIIHTLSRYQSTTTESIIVPTINDTSSSTLSSSTLTNDPTTTTEPTTPEVTSDPTVTDPTTEAITPEVASDPATPTTTSNLESATGATPIESATDEPTTSEPTTTATTTESSSPATPETATSTKPKRPKVERSKTVYIPLRETLEWFERKIRTFGKVNKYLSNSTPQGLRLFVTYDTIADAHRAAKFFSGHQYKCGKLNMFLVENQNKHLEHLALRPSIEMNDRRRVELIIPLTDPIKQYLQTFGNVEVYGMIGKNCAIAVFQTEDAAMAAVEKTPKRFQFQTGVVHVNAAILKDAEKSKFPLFNTPRTPNQSMNTNFRTKNKSHANVPSAPKSLWNETIDPNSGHTYYWHTETRQVTWARPAELGPKP